jgi:Fe-S-cluster containining protein
MEEDEFQSNLEWVRRHEGITVLGLIPGKKGFVIKIEKPCSCLDADRRCSKYDSRPEICRRFKCRAIESYEEDGYYTKSMIHGMTNETREAARRLYEEYKAKGLIPDQPKRNNK